MKRFYVYFTFALFSISLFSQNPVEFNLLPNGTFISTEGTNYVVINYQDKSSYDIYNMVRNNLSKIYNDPASALMENPYSKIRVVHSYINLGKMTVVLIPRELAGFFNLQFQFKDGRIRVDAPTIDESLICVDGTLDPGGIPSFSSYAKGLFKNGVPRENKKEQLSSIEFLINEIINYSLGLTKNDDSDDW